MKFNNFESATLRTVRYENINNISTIQFGSFDEALNYISIGDPVLAFVNGGRYIMHVFSIDNNCITCTDDVGIAQFRKNNEWTVNGLERIQYD